MRAAYFYTLDGTHWRVFEALIGQPVGESKLVVYLDSAGKIRVTNERHLNERNSGHAWVYAHEFELLAADVERDYAARQLWHKALADVKRIRRELLKPSPEGGER